MPHLPTRRVVAGLVRHHPPPPRIASPTAAKSACTRARSSGRPPALDRSLPRQRPLDRLLQRLGPRQVALSSPAPLSCPRDLLMAQWPRLSEMAECIDSQLAVFSVCAVQTLARDTQPRNIRSQKPRNQPFGRHHSQGLRSVHRRECVAAGATACPEPVEGSSRRSHPVPSCAGS